MASLLPRYTARRYVTVINHDQPPQTHPAALPEPLDPEPPGIPLDRQPAAVYLSTLAPTGRRGMRTALAQAADALTGGRATIDTCPWHRLGAQHVAVLLRRMTDGGAAPATVNRMRSALRGVLRSCWRLGLIDAEELARAGDVPGVKARRLPRGRHIATGEIAALFRACSIGPGGARDAAALALLYGCGLRRAEVVALDLADYAPDTGTVTVIGKGGHQRQVFATTGTRAALGAWLRHRGDAPGPLLFPVAKGGRIVPGRRLSTAAVWARLQTLGKRAGVQPFSPHDLRRSFIGDLLDAGADMASVQALAGHANVNTTARYDRRGERAARSAADRLHVPYVPTDL